MEISYPELPGVRSAMEATQGGGKVVTKWLRWFYVLLTAAPVIFPAPLFVDWCQVKHGPGIALIATGSVVLYLVLTTAFILRISPSSRSPAAGAPANG